MDLTSNFTGMIFMLQPAVVGYADSQENFKTFVTWAEPASEILTKAGTPPVSNEKTPGCLEHLLGMKNYPVIYYRWILINHYKDPY